MDYRERCYQSYVDTHWSKAHSLSKEEYELYAKVSRKTFKDVLTPDKQANIVDLACGSGHFLYFLKKEGYENIHGIDLSKGQLEVAEKMGIKNLSHADIFEYLPKHPRSFDMIIANDVIEHLGKDEALEFLDLIHGSLVPGGLVLISTLNARSLFGAGLVYIDYTHLQGFTMDSLSQILQVCKFEEVQVRGVKPVIHDLRSAVRAGLWWCMKNLLMAFSNIERGTGRGMWNRDDIFEPRIFAVGKKP